MNYEEARSAIANDFSGWGSVSEEKRAAQNAMAFILTDIAQSLNRIASGVAGDERSPGIAFILAGIESYMGIRR